MTLSILLDGLSCDMIVCMAVCARELNTRNKQETCQDVHVVEVDVDEGKDDELESGSVGGTADWRLIRRDNGFGTFRSALEWNDGVAEQGK